MKIPSRTFDVIFCLIGIFFIYLKLTGKTDASWFFISVPFWFCVFDIDLNIKIIRKKK